MLRGVGRWLRIAGYDTAIAASGSADAELPALATAEARVLLTCDRALGGQVPGALVLDSERFDAAARALKDRLGIDWLRAPFSHGRRMRARLERWQAL